MVKDGEAKPLYFFTEPQRGSCNFFLPENRKLAFEPRKRRKSKKKAKKKKEKRKKKKQHRSFFPFPFFESLPFAFCATQVIFSLCEIISLIVI